MHAVHFGAGNIGRGFIGLLLYQSGFKTTFVDVNEAVIQQLNQKHQYDVVLASENSTTTTVHDVSGINSAQHPEEVIRAIVDADIITTAVGPGVLSMIAKNIALGLQERIKFNQAPLNIIACENMVGGSTVLKENIYKHLTPEEQAVCDEQIGFPDAAVDRIVPNQSHTDILKVSVEPYYEWVVESKYIKGEEPPIKGITYVADLQPYIERKLFTVNTGHVVPAYVGHYLGYEKIYDAMQDETIQNLIEQVLQESGEALIQTYHFERILHLEYIDTIIQRFMNPYISDDVTRVARNPIRKLGGNDRLMRPASLYLKHTGEIPIHLVRTIAATLMYHNDADAEARKLQQMIDEKGYANTLQTVSEIDADHPLVLAVMQELDNLHVLNETIDKSHRQ